jgi:hypothetical protein
MRDGYENIKDINKILSTGDHIKSHRTSKEAKQLLNDFADKLGKYEDIIKKNEPLAIEYIQEVIMNVAWYTRNIRKALVYRSLYIASYLTLLIGIPLLLLTYSDRLTNSTIGIPFITQIILGLATVVTIQQMGNVIFDVHQRYGIWWKTESALKTVWYTTLSTWSDADPIMPGKSEAEFLLDLKASILKSRSLVADEQQDFFSNLAKPFPDILNALSSTSKAVNGLIADTSSFAASANANATAAIKARQEIEKQQTILSQLDKTIIAVNSEITNPAITVTEKNALQTRVDSLNTAKTAATTSKIAALADLAAIQHLYD